MRRILISNPVKDTFPTAHNKALIELMSNPPPDCSLGVMFSQSGGIHFARDQMADYAIKHNYDELLSWDIDLKPNLAMFHRLLSHADTDIVCGFYCKKDLHTHFNVQRILSEQPDANGLVKVSRAAIGFSKIKVSVFRKIASDTPARAYNLMNEGESKPTAYHQFFPFELMGPDSITGRYNEIRRILHNESLHMSADHCFGLIQHLFRKELFQEQYAKEILELPTYLGEDYGFCHLATQSGIPIHVDSELLIPHTGLCDYPIPTETILTMLKEPWRNQSIPDNQVVQRDKAVHTLLSQWKNEEPKYEHQEAEFQRIRGYDIFHSILELYHPILPRAESAKSKSFSIIKREGEAIWPANYVRPGLTADHCRDVLEGDYDVPYDPETPPVILDIGANIGAFARWAAQRWPGATIHCYEPHPDNFELLRRTRKEFNLADTTTVTQFAVSNTEADVELVACGFNCGEHTIFMAPELKNAKPPGITVHATDVATLFKFHLPYTILKIDAEGAELAILQRLAETSNLHTLQAIMLEFHASAHRKPIISLLHNNGFIVHEQTIHSEHRGVLKFLKAP